MKSKKLTLCGGGGSRKILSLYVWFIFFFLSKHVGTAKDGDNIVEFVLAPTPKYGILMTRFLMSCSGYNAKSFSPSKLSEDRLFLATQLVQRA